MSRYTFRTSDILQLYRITHYTVYTNGCHTCKLEELLELIICLPTTRSVYKQHNLTLFSLLFLLLLIIILLLYAEAALKQKIHSKKE